MNNASKPKVTMAKQVNSSDFQNNPQRQNRRRAPKPPIARIETYDPYENRGAAAYVSYQNGQRETAASSSYQQPQQQHIQNGRKGKRKNKFSIVAFVTIVVCSILILGASYILFPMLTGNIYRDLPTLTFANGKLLEYNPVRMNNLKVKRDYLDEHLDGGLIFHGVFVDGVHIGGKTVDEVRAMLDTNTQVAYENFKVTVNIGNKEWIFDASNVPLIKNAEAVLAQAYAYGRQLHPANGFSSSPPLEQRFALVSAMSETANNVLLHTDVTYDKAVVRSQTDEIAAYASLPPQDAQVSNFDFVRKSFTFTDEEVGSVVDADELYQQVIASLDSRQPNALIRQEAQAVMPTVTKLQLMNEYKLLSTYTTKTTSNANRNTNIRLSAEAINGFTLLPGQIMSFNETTGQRTTEKGYKEAIAISGGQNVPDIGGGVCQTSSTLFNAVARADLEIVYRSPHAWPSTYVEKGMDATVNWPNLDFKFKNNKDTPVFIIAYYADRLITVEIYGRTLGDGISIDLESEVTKTIKPPSSINYVNNTNLALGTSRETIQPRTGYEVVTYKIWYQNGQEIKREEFCTSSYRMYQRTVEYN